jgi:hypothetical protein
METFICNNAGQRCGLKQTKSGSTFVANSEIDRLVAYINWKKPNNIGCCGMTTHSEKQCVVNDSQRLTLNSCDIDIDQESDILLEIRIKQLSVC